ncbi:MAG: hypothetical protein NTY41_11200 [Proteobacteria bacterium]|nr:hypothetical protein [Pseudomonadota bacterium]
MFGKSKLTSVMDREEADRISKAISDAEMRGQEVISESWLMRLFGGNNKEQAEKAIEDEVESRGLRIRR